MKRGDIISEHDLLASLNQTWLQSIDAIVLLGGGVPLSPTEPPVYVQRRCDVVAEVVASLGHAPAVVCLSAGTAHVPQYITEHNGLPLWESTASAAYLMRHERFPVPPSQVFAETTSYDTISNAFFTKTSFSDITGWRNLLIVTNDFHIARSKEIFEWVFHAEPDNQYSLYYLSCANVGLDDEALRSRRHHEKRGEQNIRTNLSSQYTTLRGIFEFLSEKHDFYSAPKLVRRATGEEDAQSSDNTLKLSYGSAARTNRVGDMISIHNGSLVVSLRLLGAIAMTVGGLFVFRQRTGHSKMT